MPQGKNTPTNSTDLQFLELPATLYRRLCRYAKQTNQTPEEVTRKAMVFALGNLRSAASAVPVQCPRTVAVPDHECFRFRAEKAATLAKMSVEEWIQSRLLIATENVELTAADYREVARRASKPTKPTRSRK